MIEIVTTHYKKHLWASWLIFRNWKTHSEWRHTEISKLHKLSTERNRDAQNEMLRSEKELHLWSLLCTFMQDQINSEHDQLKQNLSGS